jgi:hypothetical protein
MRLRTYEVFPRLLWRIRPATYKKKPTYSDFRPANGLFYAAVLGIAFAGCALMVLMAVFGK